MVIGPGANIFFASTATFFPVGLSIMGQWTFVCLFNYLFTLQRLSEEDSNRAWLPAGGRRKASEELEINIQGWVISKRARHEREMMEKQMSATVSDRSQR